MTRKQRWYRMRNYSRDATAMVVAVALCVLAVALVVGSHR